MLEYDNYLCWGLWLLVVSLNLDKFSLRQKIIKKSKLTKYFDMPLEGSHKNWPFGGVEAACMHCQNEEFGCRFPRFLLPIS